MGTIRQTALAISISVALIAASFGTASARDTKVNKLYRIDAKIVAALEKKKIGTTKLVREHVAGKSNDKIKRWGKSNKLDQATFLKVVWQAQIIGVKEVSAKTAWLIINQCNVQGLVQLKGTEKNWLTRCVNEKSTQHGVLKNPVELVKVEAWIAGARTLAAGAKIETVAWHKSVKIERIFKPNEPVLQALRKAKYHTTIKVWEALHNPSKRAKFAKRHKLSNNALNRYVAVSDMMRMGKISPKLAHVMFLAGYTSIVNIKGMPPAALEQKLKAANRGIMKNTPDAKMCADLITAARPMKQHP